MRIQIIKQIRLMLLSALLATTAIATHAEDLPLKPIQQSSPALYRLYLAYPAYHRQLAHYADTQGFEDPLENLATVIHELIHIDSYTHRAFFIDGNYYAPYLASAAWPTLNNQTLTPRLIPADLQFLGPVYAQYMPGTPANTLGNELDEINAYGQTIPIICAYSPLHARQHVLALAGHIALTDIYLRTLKQTYPEQYRILSSNHISRGALETIIANGYTALNLCFNRGIPEANPNLIPKFYTQQFANQTNH